MLIRSSRLLACSDLRELYKLKCIPLRGMVPDAKHDYPINEALRVGTQCYQLAEQKGCIGPPPPPPPPVLYPVNPPEQVVGMSCKNEA